MEDRDVQKQEKKYYSFRWFILTLFVAISIKSWYALAFPLWYAATASLSNGSNVSVNIQIYSMGFVFSGNNSSLVQG